MPVCSVIPSNVIVYVRLELDRAEDTEVIVVSVPPLVAEFKFVKLFACGAVISVIGLVEITVSEPVKL